MMSYEQVIITWIHLVSAAIWVGGSLFIGVVLAPTLKKMSMSLEERIQIMINVGRKFNKIAVPSLILLIITGIYTSYPLLLKPNLLSETSYGTFLIVKIILVLLLVATFAVHVRIIRKDVEDKCHTPASSSAAKNNIATEITTVTSPRIMIFFRRT